MGNNCTTSCYSHQAKEISKANGELKIERVNNSLEAYKPKVKSIIRIQSLVRGWLVRKKFSIRKMLKKQQMICANTEENATLINGKKEEFQNPLVLKIRDKMGPFNFAVDQPSFVQDIKVEYRPAVMVD